MPNKLPRTTEAKFQSNVIELAKLCGWWVYHTYDSRRSQAGFPDLVLIRAPDILFWELKTDTGRVSGPQDEVLQMLTDCGLRAVVRRPCDWDLIVADLR